MIIVSLECKLVVPWYCNLYHRVVWIALCIENKFSNVPFVLSVCLMSGIWEMLLYLAHLFHSLVNSRICSICMLCFDILMFHSNVVFLLAFNLLRVWLVKWWQLLQCSCFVGFFYLIHYSFLRLLHESCLR